MSFLVLDLKSDWKPPYTTIPWRLNLTPDPETGTLLAFHHQAVDDPKIGLDFSPNSGFVGVVNVKGALPQG